VVDLDVRLVTCFRRVTLARTGHNHESVETVFPYLESHLWAFAYRVAVDVARAHSATDHTRLLSRARPTKSGLWLSGTHPGRPRIGQI
jgi:hypothetical protein